MTFVAMRVARPTVDLDQIRWFYEQVVGLPLLWSFADHDGFDGAIFGLPDERAQLELVRSPHGDVPAPTGEDALVLYHGAGSPGLELVDRLRRAGTIELMAETATLNPYWPRQGASTFVDPDGYRLIIVSDMSRRSSMTSNTTAGPSAGQHPDQSDLMSAAAVREVPAGPGRDFYLPLLELADDSVAQVRSYYQTGMLFALDADDGTPTAMILTIPEADGTVELKAVAVDAVRQGQGVGTLLLHAVLDRLRDAGVRRVIVGTSSSGIGQLAYYQKAGFRLRRIERDFFTPERGYPEGIEENGVAVRDMVWMDQDLEDERRRHVTDRRTT